MRLLTESGALKPWASAMLALIGFGASVGLLVAYVSKVDQRNIERGRQICGIIVLLDDRNQEMPPAADKATADFRAELHRYRLSLGC